MKEKKYYANKSAHAELKEALHANFINCPNCGGLIPELEIQDKERSFRFTCTQIVENGKTLAQTDYPKLLCHLLAHELAISKHLTKKDMDSPLRDFVRRVIKKTEKNLIKERESSHD
jgi:hypothetical protein